MVRDEHYICFVAKEHEGFIDIICPQLGGSGLGAAEWQKVVYVCVYKLGHAQSPVFGNIQTELGGSLCFRGHLKYDFNAIYG